MGPWRMLTGRLFPGSRIGPFFLAMLLLGAPAVVFRALCLGNACRVEAETSSDTPFCSLEPELRRLITNGFYEGRSPDVLGVTGSTLIEGSDIRDSPRSPVWPSVSQSPVARVPIMFAGAGVNPDAEIPPGVNLPDVSETIASIMNFRRPHVSVRSGDPIPDVATGQPPRLVLEIVLKGIGSEDIERHKDRWPTLESLVKNVPATFDASADSLPLDPAATLATIGTGGLPSEHGITGGLIRSGSPTGFDTQATVEKRLVTPWSESAPPSVVATLGDQLDEELNQKPLLGLVGTESIDRGLLGGHWYPTQDRDFVKLLPPNSQVKEQTSAASRVMNSKPFGKDSTPDLFAVALDGPMSDLDGGLKDLLASARRASDGSLTVVVTATGSRARETRPKAIDAMSVRFDANQAISTSSPLIEAAVPGGFFLNQANLKRLKKSDDVVIQALLKLRSESEKLFADVFPAIAVTFGRYC